MGEVEVAALKGISLHIEASVGLAEPLLSTSIKVLALNAYFASLTATVDHD